MAPLLGGCLGRRAPVAGTPPAFDRRVIADSLDVRLGFIGDLMFARNVNRSYRNSNDPADVWGSLVDRLEKLDGLFGNLECCLSKRGEKWPDKTFYFRANPDWVVPALRAVGTSWVSLANNHILDFGTPALADTRNSLSAVNIGHAGAGPDWAAATAPSLVRAGPLDVAVLAFTDRFREYRAGESEAGTAYLRLDKKHGKTRHTCRRVLEKATAAGPDLIVASLHWGPNWEVTPSSSQRQFARWLVDQGVDLVHGHSAHVVQGIECYRGRPILYDTGDFVDDYSIKPEFRNDRSFLFVLEIRDGELDALRLVPVEIDTGVRAASKTARDWLQSTMRRRSDRFDTTYETDGDALVVSLDQ